MFVGWRERERERKNVVITLFVFKEQVGQF